MLAEIRTQFVVDTTKCVIGPDAPIGKVTVSAMGQKLDVKQMIVLASSALVLRFIHRWKARWAKTIWNLKGRCKLLTKRTLMCVLPLIQAIRPIDSGHDSNAHRG